MSFIKFITRNKKAGAEVKQSDFILYCDRNKSRGPCEIQIGLNTEESELLSLDGEHAQKKERKYGEGVRLKAKPNMCLVNCAIITAV